MRYKFRSSKKDKIEFAKKMEEINSFCLENNITKSMNGDSYYFEINNQKYRVSNHSPESSSYHGDREDYIIYIHASKTRIIEIYNNLKKGYELNGRGQIK